MQKKVAKFIRAYSLCSQCKPANQQFGLYQPLLIASSPWESISMDFLSGFPPTLCKHDAIWLVVCHFSKMEIFIPCTKTTSASQKPLIFFLPTSGLILVYPTTSFLIRTLIS